MLVDLHIHHRVSVLNSELKKSALEYLVEHHLDEDSFPSKEKFFCLVGGWIDQVGTNDVFRDDSLKYYNYPGDQEGASISILNIWKKWFQDSVPAQHEINYNIFLTGKDLILCLAWPLSTYNLEAIPNFSTTKIIEMCLHSYAVAGKSGCAYDSDLGSDIYDVSRYIITKKFPYLFE